MNWIDFRPFQIALEKDASKLLKDTYKKSNCIEQHMDILRYLDNFINSYDGEDLRYQGSLFTMPNFAFWGIPKFGWVWLSLLGHDYETGVNHADPDFQRFLLSNKKKVILVFFRHSNLIISCCNTNTVGLMWYILKMLSCHATARVWFGPWCA